MTRRLFAYSIALALAVLPALAPAAELRIGSAFDPQTLDHAATGSGTGTLATESVVDNIYSLMTARGPGMKLVNDLVESWNQIDDLTYEVKLRHGVKFHSGDELTAEDVKFSFDRLTREGALDGRTSPRKALLGPVAGVEIVDPYAVRFKLSSPWPILPAYLAFQVVVNKKFTEAAGPGGLTATANGTGPFKLVEWRQGEGLVMERFADYFGGSPDLPYTGPARIDRVSLRYIPEASTRVAALLAGEVDLIDALPISLIDSVSSNPNTKVLAVPGVRNYFVHFNQRSGPFTDARVRRAANMAIDRQLIIDRILGGRALPLAGLISPLSFGYNPDLAPWKYDPAEVKRLLAEAGYPNGIDVVINSNNGDKEATEAVAAMLSQNGIRASVQVLEQAVMNDNWMNPARNQAQMMLTSWGDGALEPYGIFDPVLKTGDRGNRGGYSNAEVDRMLTQAAKESDSDKRAQLYRDAQKIVYDEAALLFLWIPEQVYGASKKLDNWDPSSRGLMIVQGATLAN